MFEISKKINVLNQVKAKHNLNKSQLKLAFVDLI